MNDDSTRNLNTAVRQPPRLRVLVVDDDDTQREFATACLAQEGWEVEAAEDAEAAEAIRARFEPHLVIMDVHMPGTSGFDLVGAWRARAGSQPVVIFVSSMEARLRYRRAMQLGGADFLIKPYSSSTLLKAAQGAVASRLTENSVDAAPTLAFKAKFAST